MKTIVYIGQSEFYPFFYAVRVIMRLIQGINVTRSSYVNRAFRKGSY